MAGKKAVTGSTEVATVKPTKKVIQDTSIESLISQAISTNVPVETLERLLALRNTIKAEMAKEAFDAAMAQFQSQCPTIVKTKEVKTRSGQVAYRYAPIESIVAQVKRPLQNNGFSYKTQIDLTEGGVKATVRVTHAAGHSEDTSMEVPLGNKTEIMSHSQVTAAASTFAKRYAFCNAFGILTGDEDTDGAGFDDGDIAPDVVPTVTYDDHESTPLTAAQQRVRIAELLGSKGVDTKDRQACEQYVADKTQLALTPGNFSAIIRALEQDN